YKLLPWATPSDPMFGRRVALIAALAAAATAAVFLNASKRRWSWLVLAAAALAPYWAIPVCARVENYPHLDTAGLEQVAAWARTETSKDALFLFPDAGTALYPGIFRAEAVRAVYVDWKSGGQVNHFKDLGEEWWTRWRETMASPDGWKDIGRFGKLGIDYVVLKTGHRPENRAPVFEAGGFSVYRTVPRGG
ncbi:MAG: DUF6798 domain-containing protein, partial [Pseudomonadota bacterium]